MQEITYPYLPEGRTISYVGADNEFLTEAAHYGKEHSMDTAVQTGAVVVKNGEVIGRGANGSDYHTLQGCERVRQGIATGQGYELCEGCHPKNHAEVRAIENAKARGNDVAGADLYLWGHWWACKPCWDAMLEAGITNVFLLEGSERFFNKEHPDNILAKALQ